MGSELYNPIMTRSTRVTFLHPDTMLALFTTVSPLWYCMRTDTLSFVPIEAPAWNQIAVPLSFSMPRTYLPAGSEITSKYSPSTPTTPDNSAASHSPFVKFRSATTVNTRLELPCTLRNGSRSVSFDRRVTCLCSAMLNCVEKKCLVSSCTG